MSHGYQPLARDFEAALAAMDRALMNGVSKNQGGDDA
jgi:hypothetical protein